jgi:hypothetical protein
VGVDREEGVEVDCFYLREELIRIWRRTWKRVVEESRIVG